MPVGYEVPLSWKNVFPNYFVQETDPALDAGNNVTAYKRWVQIDDDGAAVPAILGTFLRSPDNSSWIAEGLSDIDREELEAMVEAAVAGRLSQGTYPISGGTAAWTGTGLVYRVGAARYVIDGEEYTSAEQTVTLDAADPTDPRIDVITLDATGTVGKITGTPSSEPVKPTVEPSTHLEVTFVTIGGGATTPTDITLTSVYAENLGTGGGEWNAVATDASVNVDSSTSPITGAKSILGTSVPNQEGVNITGGAAVNVDDFSRLLFKVQPIAAWATKKTLRVALRTSGGVLRGSVVVIPNGGFGFNSQSTAAQIVGVPISAFGIAPGTTFQRVQILVGGSGAVPSFRLDDVVLESGGGSSGPGEPSGATVPAGGAAGTFLAKRSSADFDDEFRAIAQADVTGLVQAIDDSIAADLALDTRLDAAETTLLDHESRVEDLEAAPVQLTGAGSPEGVATAIPGSTFTQSDAAAGEAWWYKKTGVGNTGWEQVVSGAGGGGGGEGGGAAVYTAKATTTYVDNPDPAVDTTVKQNDGVTALEVAFTLDAGADVILRFRSRSAKSDSTTSRVRFYDNGVAVSPVNTDVNVGWYAQRPGFNSLVEHMAEAVVSLPAGSHTITVRHQAAGGTGAHSWYDRAIMVVVPEAGGGTGTLNSTVETVAGAAYTPVATDVGKYKRCTNAGGCTVTIPANADVAIAVNSEIHFRQAAAGQITFAAGAGVTLNTPETLLTAKQGATVTAKKVATNEWDLFGLLATV